MGRRLGSWSRSTILASATRKSDIGIALKNNAPWLSRPREETAIRP